MNILTTMKRALTIASRALNSAGHIFRADLADDLKDIQTEYLLQTDVDQPIWNRIETDNFRTYAVDDTNLLYLSYFDGISDKRIRNFTDTIPLDTGGEPITGIKTLRERQLAVYTPHRIILIQTDPLAELTIIISVFNTSDRDEAVGCIAPDSLVSMGGYHYFLSANKRILRFGGSFPTWQSSKIQSELETINIEYPDDGSAGISNAVGVGHKGFYYLAFPSGAREDLQLTWRDRPLAYRGAPVGWRHDDNRPNLTLIYDVDRDRWYEDGFGVESYTKDVNSRLYGVIDGMIYSLYEGDDEVFGWTWQSNVFNLAPRTFIYNVFARLNGAGIVDVTLTTEEGTSVRTVEIDNAFSYFEHRAGFNLRGETAQVMIHSFDKMLVNRIAINETF